ncbi:MAG: DUF2303 family protein [Paludibacter sp.]
MENEKLQIVLNEGQTELVIREGNAQNVLDVKPPVKIGIIGTIGAPVEFLARRFELSLKANHGEVPEMHNHFDHSRCHVIVDREEVSILLVIDEHDEYKRGTIVGKLTVHPAFQNFGINTGKRWEPNTLGQFFKMNRAFFLDKAENMKLVTLLKSFEATIDTKVEKEKKDSGSTKDNKVSVVNNNLPDNFFISIPMFKGEPANQIEVEFDATVNGSEISLQLCSPAANQLFEEMRDKTIDIQIQKIREIAPNMVIIEK